MDYLSLYKKCRLCARNCSVDRLSGGRGYCQCTSTPVIARADLHMWEEPIISGKNGSGTIFFSGCSMGCVFCQNREISREGKGETLTESELAGIMLELEKKGAHNINLVTPTHFVPSIIESVSLARKKGLELPIVYNTGSYENLETVRLLSNTADVYLPDYKYFRSKTAERYSKAENYPEAAFSAIEEMVRQKPRVVIENGLIKSGVVIRLLLLPSHIAEGKLALNRLFSAFGNNVYYSLMNQYTPFAGLEAPLNRRVTQAEYREFIDYADRIGVSNAFIQGDGASDEGFIPDFDRL